MTNILVDQLPEAVEIDGVEYEINTDFRAGLRTILAFESDDLTGREKQLILLQNLYPVVPDNLTEAARQAVKFLNSGQDSQADLDALRLYSFAKDADLIFAAFQQTHGVDLSNTEYLHWWQFLALFMDLGSETAFCNLVGLRRRLKTGKATKEERAAAREMSDLIDVPELDMRTPEEREREAVFLELVKEGENARKQTSL